MTKLDKVMDDYYNQLTSHKASLDYVYNILCEIWGKSKKPKKIKLVEEENYTDGQPIIFNREKYYVVALELVKDQVHIQLRNFQTDEYVVDEIRWYGNHDLKTLVINEVSKHLGYLLTPGIPETKKNKKKK